MLLIITNSGAEIEWHVGEPVPMIWQPERPAQYWPNGALKNLPDTVVVTELYADCNELDYICRKFVNLPQTKGRTCRWFGDMARFIHANLP